MTRLEKGNVCQNTQKKRAPKFLINDENSPIVEPSSETIKAVFPSFCSILWSKYTFVDLANVRENTQMEINGLQNLNIVQWSLWVMIGDYCKEHAPDQLVLAVSVYRISDRSVAQPVSSK